MQPDPVLRLPLSFPPKVFASAFIALGMVAAGTLAQAAPIVTTPQVRTFSLEVAKNAPFNLPSSAASAVIFNEFDGSLGTLQQVVFRWDTAFSASLTGAGYDTTEGDPVSKVDASVGAQVLGFGELFGANFTASVAEDEESVTIMPFGLLGSRTYSAPADLAYFIGAGVFSTQVALDVTVVSDNASASMNSSWQTTPRTGLFSVEYVYEAAGVRVPEPGVLFLGAAAVLAFGVAGWRRRSSVR